MLSETQTLPESSPETSDTETLCSDVFEGPEKKLEVFFSRGEDNGGLRRFQQDTWSGMLADAACTILHQESNKEFDAYLLSESSMFVYPDRLILKTCGTTTLLLALPKVSCQAPPLLTPTPSLPAPPRLRRVDVATHAASGAAAAATRGRTSPEREPAPWQLLELAEQAGCAVEHVLYSHLRYKFPEQQVYPHNSFQQEQEYLSRVMGNAQARVLGPPDGRCWYVLHASGPGAPVPLPHAAGAPKEGDDLFEIAMEGLNEDVCARFFKAAHPDLDGKELAQRMTAVSGIGELLPGVKVDDWAFEPCGYSMNGLRDGFYYTIHVTPESGFSYASFETNDPKYREPKWVERFASTFAPSSLTLTLTTRRVGCELDAFRLVGYERSGLDTTELGKELSVCSMNFARPAEEDVTVGAAVGSRRPYWAES